MVEDMSLTNSRFLDVDRIFMGRERYSLIPSRPLYLPPMYEMGSVAEPSTKTGSTLTR